MSATVGYATLQVIPSARGFGPALGAQTAAPVAAAGKTAGKGFGGSMLGAVKGFAGPLGLLLGGAAVVGFAKGAVSLEKEFSQTMNTLGAVADVPKADLRELSDLAVKFGQDTIFSTNEAADAMLELAKGGLTAAQIKTGALDATLTMASASGASLEFSATTLANAMNAYGLKAGNASEITAALAGAANASTASIESIAQALSQVGPGAVDAGLSIQETTAALAAFDNAGVKGSDAGTSLKTFLARLVPQTDRAGGAFADLGLKMTDSEGNFISLAAMAQELKEGIRGMSDEERTAALNAAFGSDARRAALILAEQGAKGLEKLTKATSDQDAAQRVADARMKGTAGALEQLSGSWDTLQLAVGQVLKPLVKFGALGLTEIVNSITPYVTRLADVFSGKGASLEGGGFIGRAADGISKIFDALMPLVEDAYDVIANDLVPSVRDFWHAIEPAVLWLSEQGLPSLIGQLQGLWTMVSGVTKIFAGVLNFLTGVFTGDWSKAWKGIRQIVAGAWGVIRGLIKTILSNIVLRIIPRLIGKIPGLFKAAWGLTLRVFVKIAAAIGEKVRGFLDRIVNNVRVLGGWLKSKFGEILGAVRDKFAEIFGRVVEIVRSKGSQILDWFRDLPGRIKSVFSSAGTWLKDAGVSIVQGLLDGAGSILPDVGQFFVDKLPGWIQTPFKKALGINSPSRVFMGYGDNIAEGLAMGVERSKGKPQSAVANMVGVPRAPKVAAGGAIAAAVGASGGEQPVVLTLDGKVVAETVFTYGGRKLNHGRV